MSTSPPHRRPRPTPRCPTARSRPDTPRPMPPRRTPCRGGGRSRALPVATTSSRRWAGGPAGRSAAARTRGRPTARGPGTWRPRARSWRPCSAPAGPPRTRHQNRGGPGGRGAGSPREGNRPPEEPGPAGAVGGFLRGRDTSGNPARGGHTCSPVRPGDCPAARRRPRLAGGPAPGAWHPMPPGCRASPEKLAARKRRPGRV
jgi:hypothetical protein